MIDRIISQREATDDTIYEVNYDTAKGSSGKFFLERYFCDYGIAIHETKNLGDATLYALEQCLFDPAHKGGQASIVQHADGKLNYQCFHDSCKGYTWKDARKKISGDESLKKYSEYTNSSISVEYNIGKETASQGLLGAPPEFPLEVLPDCYAEMAKTVSRAMIAPRELAAGALISVAGASIGLSRCIKPMPHWEVYPNLYICAVAKSGVGKTPVTRFFFKPLKDIDSANYKKYKSEKELLESSGEVATAVGSPIYKQNYIDDATMESLPVAFETNRRGILWHRDELSGLFRDLDKYNSNGRQSGAKARLLSAYDSQDWKTTRKNSEPILIEKPCLSIFGTIQNKVLETMFDGQDLENGLIPRFLFYRSEQAGPRLWSGEKIGENCEIMMKNLVDYLTSLEQDEKGDPRTVRLSDEALATYIEWFDKIASEQYNDIEGEVFEIQTPKSQEHCLRLCLILHALDSAAKDEAMPEVVPHETMRRAIRLTDWFRVHQRQVWQLMGIHERARATDTRERQLARAILELSESIENEFLPTEKIVERYNAGKEDSFKLKPEAIGKLCVKLGLQSKRTAHARGYRVSENDLNRLSTLIKPVTPVTTDRTLDTQGHEPMTAA